MGGKQNLYKAHCAYPNKTTNVPISHREIPEVKQPWSMTTKEQDPAEDKGNLFTDLSQLTS